MRTEGNILGIDIGSISIAAVELSCRGDILNSSYLFHEGHIKEKLQEALREINLERISGLAFTSSVPDIFVTGKRYDSCVSIISAAKKLHPAAGSILIVGGEKFGLVSFDDEGSYRNYRSNTSCAAGTGSFLDQQALRLNLTAIQDFCKMAESNTGHIPKIASRCAVFAKTDLIHAQQEGYTLAEICDGLCSGLAKNVADTLFTGGLIASPMIMAGGVSKNTAVVKHLSRMVGQQILVDELSHLYGAYGAALLLQEEDERNMINISSINELFKTENKERSYHYEALELKLSEYPDFSSIKSYVYKPKFFTGLPDVETDIYIPLKQGHSYAVYLGIDIGSTSTKAAIIDENTDVIAGFYTRTSGRPLEAVQTIFETIDDMMKQEGCSFDFKGVGTTGSGRKFIGKIIGADTPLDEITAHARAAYALDPEVDTIIEIGGQDAKFTTMKNGMVTFSIMNNVCAAGTGSFVEEQAKKLGCPLREYSQQAVGMSAPLASDRCTVFMERDLNYYLSENYSTGEVLASVLHSVRENYLTKVAIEKNIGDKIFFQGATAKNKALVAAFEQRLGKPIMVSKFCHLTGALGAALHLLDEKIEKTSFRGIDIYKESIPVSSEVCTLCNNNCKIKLVNIAEETVAFGFLCGRDYETKKFVDENKSGFDLLRERKKLQIVPKKEQKHFGFTVGIPSALHLTDELYLWKYFFNELGVHVITSEGYKDGIGEGKKITGAEFCAPITEMHGHTQYLLEKADYLFLPAVLEHKIPKKGLKRNYCYYTQYITSLIKNLNESGKPEKSRIMSPVMHSVRSTNSMKKELYDVLKKTLGGKVSYSQVSAAYERALAANDVYQQRLAALYNERKSSENINIVLLGRPYTILSRAMNKGIPEIFGKSGLNVFFQDMITRENGERDEDINALLDAFHWDYAVQVLDTADTVAKTEGLYPVLITSFKCTPDAYTVDYFKQIMEKYDKPYLILQLDEHDSNVGYETRIEAGIRSFRNHHSSSAKETKGPEKRSIPNIVSDASILREKIVLLPRWDSILGRLMPAVLKRDGIDARLVEESPDSIQRSLSHNTGQCIPLNIIVQNCIDYVRKYNLDPAKTVMWNVDSQMACNLGLFPYYSKALLESIGGGMEKIDVYTGKITFLDVGISTALNMYLAYMLGGTLRRVGCKIRPYEIEKGQTDEVLEKSINMLINAFAEKLDIEKTVIEIVRLFEAIAIKREKRPKIAIFGDLYARDNEVLNQNIIKVIEDNGGEAITTPYSELIKIIADPYIQKWFREGSYVDAAISKALKPAIGLFERKYYKYFKKIINEPLPASAENISTVLEQFNVKLENSGESMENILKIHALTQVHSDIALFVQTNPAFCCPSLVTEAMSQYIEKYTGVPVITIEYDGTGGFKNNDIIPYLKFPRKKKDLRKKTDVA